MMSANTQSSVVRSPSVAAKIESAEMTPNHLSVIVENPMSETNSAR
jgi:hypothetical protein